MHHLGTSLYEHPELRDEVVPERDHLWGKVTESSDEHSVTYDFVGVSLDLLPAALDKMHTSGAGSSSG